MDDAFTCGKGLARHSALPAKLGDVMDGGSRGPRAPSALNGPGLNCPQGTFSVEGTFSGTMVNRTAFSNGLVCNGLAATLTGNYTATLQAAQVRRGQDDADVLDIVRRAIRRALP